MAPLPNLFIIGAMRCGTTSLARWLGAHPDVFICRAKEPHFFDRKYHLGMDWYEQHFAAATTERAIGEATQTYLYHASAQERLARTFPDARLVALVRDPVDRAYSHYWLERARGREELSFAAALDAEPERLATEDPITRDNYSYVDRGRYVRQLRSVLEHFPGDALRIIVFEDLRDRPAESFAALCRWLGVDDGVRPVELGHRANSHATFRSLAVRRYAKRLPAPLGKVLARLNTRRVSYPPMEHTVRDRLVATFAEDNEDLARRFGLDLSHWKRPS